jgi:hypothetical protein
MRYNRDKPARTTTHIANGWTELLELKANQQGQSTERINNNNDNNDNNNNNNNNNNNRESRPDDRG